MSVSEFIFKSPINQANPGLLSRGIKRAGCLIRKSCEPIIKRPLDILSRFLMILFLSVPMVLEKYFEIGLHFMLLLFYYLLIVLFCVIYTCYHSLTGWVAFFLMMSIIGLFLTFYFEKELSNWEYIFSVTFKH